MRKAGLLLDGRRLIFLATGLIVLPLLMGADGGGCAAGGKVPVGAGDGAGRVDAGVVLDAASTVVTACKAADCAGVGKQHDVMQCPDGTSIGRSLCVLGANGCEWGFGDCPPVVATDAAITVTACKAADCAGVAKQHDVMQCPDGTSIGRSLCVLGANGCAWGFGDCPPVVATDAAITVTACKAADCAGVAKNDDTMPCPDGTSMARSLCVLGANGCEWGFGACPPVVATDAAASNPQTPDARARDADACPGARLSQSRAAALILADALATIPTLNPTTTVAATEVNVPGIWDTLGMQVFVGDLQVGGSTGRTRSYVYEGCGLTFLDDLPGYSINSGLVAGQAFYYAYQSGSGCSRGNIARVTRDSDGSVSIVRSDGYTRNCTPTALEIRQDGDKIAVEWGQSSGFNTWQLVQSLGTLRDNGSSIVVVDGSGQVVPGMQN